MLTTVTKWPDSASTLFACINKSRINVCFILEGYFFNFGE